jgi:hypothetical protein
MTRRTMPDRVQRLRDLIARLEQAPPSRRRDLLLLDARDRVVKLKTCMDQSSTWRLKPESRPKPEPPVWQMAGKVPRRVV